MWYIWFAVVRVNLANVLPPLYEYGRSNNQRNITRSNFRYLILLGMSLEQLQVSDLAGYELFLKARADGIGRIEYLFSALINIMRHEFIWRAITLLKWLESHASLLITQRKHLLIFRQLPTVSNSISNVPFWCYYLLHRLCVYQVQVS